MFSHLRSLAYDFFFLFQLRKKLFGHKRTNSDNEDFLCPINGVDTPLSTPSVSRENSQNGRPGHKRNGSLPRTEVCTELSDWLKSCRGNETHKITDLLKM